MKSQKRRTQPRWVVSLPRRFCLTVLMGLCVIFGLWLLNDIATLRSAAQKSVDAFLVLGGSVTREIYATEIAKQYPQTPILISKGSPDPCILLIFQRAQAPIQNVWLEKCANSTFGNFYYSLPILRQWRVHKVKLITSPTHLPRAKWLAQIILGSHGIWVDLDIVKETGIPGNRESFFMTAADLGRGLIWALISQFYYPKCSQLIPLSSVDLTAWKLQGFKCEHQANLKY